MLLLDEYALVCKLFCVCAQYNMFLFICVRAPAREKACSKRCKWWWWWWWYWSLCRAHSNKVLAGNPMPFSFIYYFHNAHAIVNVFSFPFQVSAQKHTHTFIYIYIYCCLHVIIHSKQVSKRNQFKLTFAMLCSFII